MSKAVYTYK